MDSTEIFSPADEDSFDLDAMLNRIEKEKKSRTAEESLANKEVEPEKVVSNYNEVQRITYKQYRDITPQNEDCYLLFNGSVVTIDELFTIVRNEMELYGVDMLQGNYDVPNCEEITIGIDANYISLMAMCNFSDNGEVLSDKAISELNKLCDTWNKKHSIVKVSAGRYLVNIEEKLKELKEL